MHAQHAADQMHRDTGKFRTTSFPAVLRACKAAHHQHGDLLRRELHGPLQLRAQHPVRVLRAPNQVRALRASTRIFASTTPPPPNTYFVSDFIRERLCTGGRARARAGAAVGGRGGEREGERALGTPVCRAHWCAEGEGVRADTTADESPAEKNKTRAGGRVEGPA